MSFLESPVFPETISFHSRGGPGFSTPLVKTEGGWEYGNQTSSGALRRYVIDFDARKASIFASLPPFFLGARAKLNYFRFKDWTDYQHNDNGGTGVFVATGVANQFQVTKRYSVGTWTYDRPIKKPRAGLVITGGVSPVLDTTTGLVTVSSSTPTAWTGTFDVPVRFDIDDQETEIIDRNVHTGLILGWQSIAIAEVRV